MADTRRDSRCPAAVDGHVALVTGASRGIGAATARLLAQAGARVAVHYHQSVAGAEAVVDAIRTAGGEAFAVGADVREREAVEAMVSLVDRTYGPVEILVNNAVGRITLKPFDELEWPDYQGYLDVVLKGAVHCCQAVVPAMRERGWGKIINIGTTALHELNPNSNAYISSKATLIGMTRSLATTLGPHGITVNMVVPGLIWTRGGEGPPPGWGKDFLDRTPMNRLGSAEDIARVILFFASPLSDFVTGAYLPVCGGQVMI